MSYRWIDHTAEVELHVEAPTPQDVLVESMAALAELWDGAAGNPLTRELRLQRSDLEALLVGWLEELLFLADTEGFVPEEAELDLSDGELRAIVRGRVTEPRPLVKAVTYHGLQFEPAADGWHASVVLDV